MSLRDYLPLGAMAGFTLAGGVLGGYIDYYDVSLELRKGSLPNITYQEEQDFDSRTLYQRAHSGVLLGTTLGLILGVVSASLVERTGSRIYPRNNSPYN